MATKRGKSQARRSGGSNAGIPGWAWMVLGILLAVVVIIVAPKYLKSDGDGFFRPQPNPDAQPVAVAEEEDSVAPEGELPAPRPKAGPEAERGDFAFYDLLPGKEVPLSDAELAATEEAEARREAARREAQDAADRANDVPPATTALPQPVDGEAARTPAAEATAGASAPARTATEGDARYLLQAGAFKASGQAEEMKAKIALLGLGARVEAAQIGGDTVYRVRMGPYGTAGDLAEAKRKLSAGGLPAMAIKVK